MTTTIKVSDETKQLLDMLQAKMTLTLRRKKTLTELIDDITRLALRHEDELLGAKKSSHGKEPATVPQVELSVKNDVCRVDIYTED